MAIRLSSKTAESRRRCIFIDENRHPHRHPEIAGHRDLAFLSSKPPIPEIAGHRIPPPVPPTTVNYFMVGSGGENFNKAKADEWMARIDEALHVFPKENDEKYRAKKGESEEAKEKRTDALNEHRQAWAEQAQETYVRAGLVGGISGSAKVSLLKDKIDGAARGKRTGREGTTISAASLDEYVGYNSSDGNKKKEHDRSYSQRFASYAKEVEVSWAGWQGVYKTGANYVGEDRTEFWEGEFKIPAAWPASSIMALGLSLIHI